MSTSLPLQPRTVQVVGTELAILWNDDRETYIPLTLLRESCPCASCSGEPDALGRVVRPPQAKLSATAYEWRGHRIVGGYALQPEWGDGHQTGIYSWPFLRHLDQGTPA